MPNIIDLKNLKSSQGFKIFDANEDSDIGFSVSRAGDVNGDKIDDIIIGAPNASFNNRIATGVAYVIYGKSSGLNYIDLTNLSPTQGFKIIGAVADDHAGWSVSSAGDINSDGADDIIIGAPFENYYTGTAYIIYGKLGGLSNIDLENFTLAQGFKINGQTYLDFAGNSVSYAGDVNKDGIDDIVVGAYNANPINPGIGEFLGVAYVIYGKLGGLGNINLGNLTVPQGFKVIGSIYDGWTGFSVSYAGDINKDGIDDIIIGAPGIAEAYVVYGKSGGLNDINLANITAEQGIKIIDTDIDDTGQSVSNAGDVNGDGIDDVIIGMYSQYGIGATYIIYGNNSTLNDIDLVNLTTTQGIKISGAAPADGTGNSVSYAGDVNQDGIDDIVVGAYNAHENSGAVYVIYGKVGGLTDIDLANLSVTQGFKIIGIPKDTIGTSVSNAGDINCDGIDDILIGATNAEAVYVIYGFNTTISNSTVSNITNIICTHTAAISLNSLKPYDLAVLSLKVYDDSDDQDISLPDGWSESISSDDVSLSDNGYFARIYIKDDTAIIAQRGTNEFWKDFMVNGVLKIPFDSIPTQFASAQVFANHTISHLCDLDPNVRYLGFTGHSLGATLAELLSAKFKYPAITFESPGTREMLEDNANDFPSDAISYADANVITYNAAPNLVNTMADHVGTIIRVYPSVNTVLASILDFIGLFVDYLEYAAYTYYSYDQHQIREIVENFNPTTKEPNVIGEQKPWPSGSIDGYNGYDNYKSLDTNPYYWHYSLQSFVLQHTISAYLGSWASNVKSLLKFSNEWTLTVPKIGVNITGDDTGNIIWGTTNFADRIIAGTGDDTHYMYQGDDYSFDSGGINKYIIPIGILGKKTIDDAARTGSILLGDTIQVQFSGNAIPVLQSLCPIVSVNDHFLNLERTDGYYIIQQGNDLLITPDCANTVSELTNSLTLKNFVWGDFSINQYPNNDTAVLVGSNGDDYLDCSLYKKLVKKCFTSALEGADITVAEIGQNAVLNGYNLGEKVFMILEEQDSGRRILTASQSYSINIIGIKQGDTIDLIELTNATNSTYAQLVQNGTHMYLNLTSTTILTAEITLGNSYVNFNFSDGIIEVSNRNMTQVLENAGINISSPIDTTSFPTSLPTKLSTNPPSKLPTELPTVLQTMNFTMIPTINPISDHESSNSYGSWFIPTIVSSSIAGIALVGGLGWFMYKHYYSKESIQTELEMGTMID